MMRKMFLFLECVTVVMLCLLFSVVGFAAEHNPVEVVSEVPIVARVKGFRGSSIGDYDSTDNHIFFAYSEKISIVDAYDMNGKFAFSIEFDIDKHGAISLRCEDGLLYIMTKKGNVFVFDGDHQIAKYTEEDAVSSGYNWQWFEEKIRNVKLIGISFLTADSEGQYTKVIPVPFDVVWGIYSAYSIHVVIVFAVILSLYRNKTKQKQCRL